LQLQLNFPSIEHIETTKCTAAIRQIV